jgi:uncharacterized membrane protein required for colicin V production
MSQFDFAMAALVVVFAYAGYRRGLLAFVLLMAGGMLAFALAAVLAPPLAAYVAPALRLPEVVARPVAVVVMTGGLRFVFGFAVRELASVVRSLVHAIRPLAMVDHVLGVAPGIALGALVVLAVTLGALTLPAGNRVHNAAAESWLARNVVERPEETVSNLRRLWHDLIVTPPEIAVLPLAAGIGGLWLGAVAAWWLRRGGPYPDLSEAPTRRVLRPASGEAGVADPMALPRFLAGLAAASAMMAVLLLLTRVR